ncbi:adhesion G protein-coupled receptor L3-like [Saccostrea cucullata]|uniref:adhesion G protein-coupled receptor L3-like n=1 Tax=Saccostrea cuccullata TaxID=36930 RepID=UPI002ED2D22B
MKKLLAALFIPLYVSAISACKGVQEILLQPYIGEMVAYPENFPINEGYEAKLNCSWKISTVPGYEIVFYPKWKCNEDMFLSLYYDASGTTNRDSCVSCSKLSEDCSKIIQTGSSGIHLNFRTVTSYKYGGFQFRFMSVEKKKSSLNVCAFTNKTLLAEATPKYITSPGFPAEYPRNLRCSWTVEAAVKKKDIQLVLEFRSMYLEDDGSGCSDYIRIDGLELCEESEKNILQTSNKIILNGSSTEMQFVSDIGFGGSGFLLAFYIQEKMRKCPCQHGGTCLNSTCVCLHGYKGDNCENESLEVLSFKANNVLLREGKSVNFELELIDDSIPSAQWFRNGIGVTSASLRYLRNSIITANGLFSYWLNISNVLQRDEGNWTVEASNAVTTAYRSIRIRVLPKLLLQMTPQYDFSIQTGEIIYLQCTVLNPESLNSLTNGNLIWQKNGKNIRTDTDFGINVGRTNISSTLRKTSARLDDSGTYLCSYSSYPEPTNVSITVKVTKPDQVRCPGGMFENIIWNATVAGTTKTESCPPNQKGTATRYCDTQGVWDVPDLISCADVALVNASKQLDILLEDGVNNTEEIQKTVDNTLLTMKNLTSRTANLSTFFEVVDKVLSIDNAKSWTDVQEKTEKDASFLLKNMDRLSEVIMKNENVTPTNFTGINFEVTIDQTNIHDSGIIFPYDLSNDTSSSMDEYATFFELPKQAKRSEKAIAYVAVLYKTMSEFLHTSSDLKREDNLIKGKANRKSKEDEDINSEILSLTTQRDLGDLFPPLNLTFKHLHQIKSSKRKEVCVSWNYTENKWSSKGCKVVSSNSRRTVCQCTHLTNFAILMRPYTSDKEDKTSLKTLSLVGIIVSIAFTVLTVVIYAMIWKHIKSDQNVILLNLCVSLVLSYVIFISAVEETNDENLCIAMTAIIHYLFLVTFFCMMGMGVYYFMSITVTYYAMHVANNFKSKSRVHWFLLGGWGIPLIIAVLTLGAFWGNNYHAKNYCWLSMKSGSLLLFIVPVCIIVLINLLIIVSLMRVLFATSTMIKSTLHKKAVSGLRSLGTLVPVLGVTWIFGILAVNENAEVFQYIFIIANCLQGLFIFVSHVVLNKKVSFCFFYPLLKVP